MNASTLKRTVAITAVVAVPWIGCSLWSARRERAEKAALAAEIRADLAALPPLSDPRGGRADLTAAYDTVLAAAGEELLPDTFQAAMEEDKPWTVVPPAVAAVLEASAPVFAAFEAGVEGAPPGHLTFRGLEDMEQWWRVEDILPARGRAAIARGDWKEALRTARLIRRVADDLASSRSDYDGSLEWRASLDKAKTFEMSALLVLQEAAIHPALPPEVAAEALGIARGPWHLTTDHERVSAIRREAGDRLLLDLAERDFVVVLKERGYESSSTLAERVEGLLSREEKAPYADLLRIPFTEPLTASTLRTIRRNAARSFEGHMRRDGESVRVGVDLEWEMRRDLGGGWTAGYVGGIEPALSRAQWWHEARIPVLRAAFALRIQEGRTGRVPETLAELVPSILDVVPVDAWTGQPVKYKPRPGGWVLEAGPPKERRTHEDGSKASSRPFWLKRDATPGTAPR